MLRKWRNRLRMGMLFPLLLWIMTGCAPQDDLSTLTPAGEVAEEQLWLMKFSLYVMLIVFVVVIALFVYVLVKYRKRKGQTGIPEQVEGNHTLEIIWTVIPFIMLFVLAIPTVIFTFKYEKVYSSAEALQVKVVAHQYWWEFQYPDLKINTSQDLYLPAGKKVQFELTSQDVIHSFWIPAIGGKRDTNPGLINQMYLIPEKEGVFKGKCAELCGPSHALMDFRAIVLSETEFNEWAEKMKVAKAETALSGEAAKGQEIFKQQNCIACHAVDNLPDAKGAVAPYLANFADRETVASIKKNTRENVIEWIREPNSIKPGNRMVLDYPGGYPKFTDEELNALATYLETLHVYKKEQK